AICVLDIILLHLRAQFDKSEAGILPPLLPLLLRKLPHILDAGGDLDVEQLIWSLLMWFKVFPEEIKRQVPFTDLIQLLKDRNLRIDSNSRFYELNKWGKFERTRQPRQIRELLADPSYFPQS
ncbi:hypothetical protein V5O48_015147, partial [Marasmius crinis-equi]